MAETAPHVALIIYMYQVLRYWLRAMRKVCVHADMFVYYREGYPKDRVAPDVFVVWGVPQNDARRSYKLWEEKQAPQVVFEITSTETKRADLGKKRTLYARLGVEEYYLFDPFGEYLDPPLRGYQLIDNKYVEQPLETSLPPSFDGKDTNLHSNEFSHGWRLKSERLKLEIWALASQQPEKPHVIRFFDPAAGKWLHDPEQAMIEREMFEKQAREAEARAECEAMLREAEAQARRAAEERAEREAKARQAEAEARKAAEAELSSLKAELEKLRGKNNANASD
jgi:Uma2 family endonuclease